VNQNDCFIAVFLNKVLVRSGALSILGFSPVDKTVEMGSRDTSLVEG
jgi:hypothetical protein